MCYIVYGIARVVNGDFSNCWIGGRVDARRDSFSRSSIAAGLEVCFCYSREREREMGRYEIVLRGDCIDGKLARISILCNRKVEEIN